MELTIHELSVSNYRSIYEEVVLDLRIPGTAPDLPRFRPCQAKPAVRLPTVAVIMGPNGSGKTTLLRALLDLTRIAFGPDLSASQARMKRVLPFWSNKAAKEPTRFRLEFDADWLQLGGARDLFRYELSIEHVPSERHPVILREALFHFPKGRPKRLFERGAPGETIYTSPEFGLKPKDARLDAVRKDTSVITAFAALNVPLAMRIVETQRGDFSPIEDSDEETWQPDTELVLDFFERNSKAKSWMKQQMQRSDLAIHDVLIRSDGGEMEAFFRHHGLDREVPLMSESTGTFCLFHALPQIHMTLEAGGLLILDDVDGSLHVDIVSEIIHWFHSPETNPHNAQLIVSAHNVGLLDDLEKEELFIVEKGPDSATRLYAAQDVSGLRRDTRLYPKYRSGVLGGLPKIG
ncbi:MAG: AAA family ATPase [Desulfurellaceae bacterium]|nr:AAA family ATPase [Desulfurellaceae bacterium]